jgi:hypothetical protein
VKWFGLRRHIKKWLQYNLEKEGDTDEEPDIYGTLDDTHGDKLDIAGFVGSPEKIILHLDDNRYLEIVFLDESGELELVGDFVNR